MSDFQNGFQLKIKRNFSFVFQFTRRDFFLIWFLLKHFEGNIFSRSFFCSVVFVAAETEFPTKNFLIWQKKYAVVLSLLFSRLRTTRFQLPMICVTFSEKSKCHIYPQSTMSYRSATPPTGLSSAVTKKKKNHRKTQTLWSCH